VCYTETVLASVVMVEVVVDGDEQAWTGTGWDVGGNAGAAAVTRTRVLRQAD